MYSPFQNDQAAQSAKLAECMERFLCSQWGPARSHFTPSAKPVFFSMAVSQATNPTKTYFGCRFLLLRPLVTSSEVLRKKC